MWDKLKALPSKFKSYKYSNLMYMFFSKNFRIIFLSITSLNLCILLLYSVVYYNFSNSKSNAQFQSLLEQTSGMVDNVFESTVATLEALSQDKNLFFVINTTNITYPFNYANTLKESMRSFAMINSCIDSICVYSVKNNIFMSTDLNAQKWFTPPKLDSTETKRRIEIYPQFKQNNFPAVITVYRQFFSSENGGYLGYIAININCLSLKEKISSSIVSKSAHLLATYNGNVIFSDDYEKIGLNIANSSVLNTSPNSSVFKNMSQLDGIEYRLLVMNNTQSDFIASSINNILLIGLILLILSIIVSLTLSVKIFIPYKNIIKALQNDNGKLLPANYLTDLEYIEDQIVHYSKSNSALSGVISKQAAEIHQLTLASLQAQIHPHFIYNIIDCISWASYAENPESNTHDALFALAKLMKMSYDYSSPFISVADERAFLTSYTDLLLFKSYNSFTVNIDFDTSIMDFMIPKMIIQPVVENAFNHGISKNNGRGQIDIIGHRNGESLVFIINDDGPGLDGSKIISINQLINTSGEASAAEHIGLYNISERLHLIYGQRAYVELSERSDCSQGLSVKICIPIDTEKTKDI
ncbi:MAG: histidine kinase [Clostridia bacterium]|nr:histidine kinase [Clostridia bacterium]